MTSPDWSDEHVSRANRFTTHVIAAWLVLTSLNAALAPTGTLGFVVTGLAVVAAAWLLVHSLFTQVDGLVKARLEEAGGTTNGADATSGEASD